MPLLSPDAVSAVFKLTVEYVGTRYCGWQVQANGPSVQAELEAAWERLTGRFARVRGAGRTDAGVHARGQVAAVRAPEPSVAVERLAQALNSRLPDDIVVRRVERAAPDFDPRHGCVLKRYRYRLATGPIRPGREAPFLWHVKGPFDAGALAEAAAHFVGTHDFASFAKAPGKGADAAAVNTVRGVERVRWRARPRRLDPAYVQVDAAGKDVDAPLLLTPGGPALPDCPDGYWFWVDVEGRSFLYNMVRAMVGTMVDAAQGRRSASEIPSMLAARDRRAAGMGAPARGLCLEWIRYP